MIYTFRCPNECEHCCYECGPHREEKCDPSQAATWVEAAARHGCTDMGFSGGECLLYMDEVLELSRIAAEAGLTPTIATGAFWATSPDAAGDVVGKLQSAGVRRVVVSADAFHQKSVSLERVRNALAACSAASMEVHVSVTRTRRDAEWEKEARGILEPYMKHVRYTMVGPVGRWRSHHAEFPRGDRERVDVCRSVFEITIYPNGDVYPCCSGAIGEVYNRGRNALRIGNDREEDPGDILERAEHSIVLNALRIAGPNGLLDVWGDAAIQAQVPQVVRSRCELCLWLAEHLDGDAVQSSSRQLRDQYVARLEESWRVRRRLFPDP